MRAILLLLIASFILTAAAEETTVYKRVRPDGTVEFSDEPTPGGRVIEVPGIQTYSFEPPPPPAPPQRKSESVPPAEVRYQRIQVTAPAADETVYFDANGMPVSVVVKPELQPGHVISLYLDGQRAARGSSASFTLQDVYRGTHTLTAVVEDGRGTTLLRSAPVTFHMVQHTRRP